MEKSRKRTSSNADIASGHAIKRPKIGDTYNPFTEDQHTVIENTASIFQIHPSDLAAAIGSLQRSSNTKISNRRPNRQNFDCHATTYPSALSQESVSSQVVMRNEGDSSSSSSRKSALGNVLPANLASCFANLVTTEDVVAKTLGNRGPDTGNNSNQDGRTYPASRYGTLRPLYSDKATESSVYVGKEFDFEIQEQEASSMCNPLFACDTPFRMPFAWQPLYSDHSIPPMPQPNMTYSQQQNPVATNQGFFPNSRIPESPEILFNNRPPNSMNIETTSPSWNDTPIDCPLLDFNIEDDSNRPRRGPFKDPTDRAQTAQTRKDNACVRCKMQRTRCVPNPFDPRGVCLTCKKVANTRVVNLPCLRYKIPDARLFREGYVTDLLWSKRWESGKMDDISTWEDSEVRIIHVTQDYSPNPIVLRVRRFVPMEGDKLWRTWKHAGINKSVELPPYAIENLKDAERTYKDYITSEGAHFFQSTLDKEDPLVWETYSMAIKASKSHMSEPERILLNMVLRLWVTVRMLCRSERIKGIDRLGIRNDLVDRTSPMHGKTPIPPVMGAQIELVLIQGIMNPLRLMILEQLQKLILAHKPQNWFCIYLCTFILLHNASLITKQDVAYSKKHGRKTKFAMEDMIADLHMGANAFLAYFHYVCKGHYPFTMDWNAADSVTMAALDPYQVAFIQKSAAYVKANALRARLAAPLGWGKMALQTRSAAKGYAVCRVKQKKQIGSAGYNRSETVGSYKGIGA
ncbi:hypothetical protein VTL71DRAFT_8823 [Oculimacula yallundae]|uniref:Zn(2)-C6 fungal-type domain-containing protein n=1 Tax=Oculimacula yallundae TaxID=86028 RepID=A0ABR4CYW6_9HELO